MADVDARALSLSSSRSQPSQPSQGSRDWDVAMRIALAEADAAAAVGDVPVGALLVSPDGTTFAARNLREASRDPTAHAEMVAVRAAAVHAGHWRLDGWTCVATLEPCAMCAGALVNARVARLVFGCRDPKAGAVCSLFPIGRDARLNHRFEVVEGVMAEACAERLRTFFAARRAEGKK